MLTAIISPHQYPPPVLKRLISTTILFNFILVFLCSAQKFDAYGYVDNSGNATTYNEFVVSPTTNAIYAIGVYGGNNVDFDLRTSSTSTMNSSNSGTNFNSFLVKYNEDGSIAWKKNLSYSSSTINYGEGLAIDASDNVYITGRFTATMDVDYNDNPGTTLTANGCHDVYVIKYNSSGTHQWSFNMGSSDACSSGEDGGYDIVCDGSSNIYIVGYFGGAGGNVDFDPSTNTSNLTANGTWDIFLAKYDGTLSPSNTSFFKWARNFGGASTEQKRDVGFRVAVDSNDDVYVTGVFQGENVDFDPSATRTFNLSSNYDGSGTGDNNYEASAFVTKYNSGGGFSWAFDLTSSTNGSFNWCYGRGIDIDDNDDVYVCGYMKCTVDFDPSTDVANLSSSSCLIQSNYIAKYDSTGAYEWAHNIVSTQAGSDAYYCLADHADNVWVVGSFDTDDDDIGPERDSIDFDHGAGVENHIALGLDKPDAYVISYKSNGDYNMGITFGGHEVGNSATTIAKCLGFQYNYAGLTTTEGGGKYGGVETMNWGGAYVLAAGEWTGATTFDPKRNTNSRESSGGAAYAFFWKYGSNDGADPWDWDAPPANGAVLPLPVKLLQFDAIKDNDDVLINWLTASETNSAYFTVERSQNGIYFEEVCTEIAAGRSNEYLNYTCKDLHPLSGVSYYRLKQTDLDGTTEIFDLVPVNFNKDLSFSLFPNPRTPFDNTYINLINEKEEEVLVVLHDITGKELFSKVTITQDNGDNIIALDEDNKLSPGIYMVTASSNDKIFRQKLVIK